MFEAVTNRFCSPSAIEDAKDQLNWVKEKFMICKEGLHYILLLQALAMIDMEIFFFIPFMTFYWLPTIIRNSLWFINAGKWKKSWSYNIANKLCSLFCVCKFKKKLKAYHYYPISLLQKLFTFTWHKVLRDDSGIFEITQFLRLNKQAAIDLTIQCTKRQNNRRVSSNFFNNLTDFFLKVW